MTQSPYEGAVYAYDAVKALVNGLRVAAKAEEHRLLHEFLNATKLDQFLALNNLTLAEMDEINKKLEKRFADYSLFNIFVIFLYIAFKLFNFVICILIYTFLTSNGSEGISKRSKNQLEYFS